MKFLLELGFEVLKSVNTCWGYGILPWSMNSCLRCRDTCLGVRKLT